VARLSRAAIFASASAACWTASAPATQQPVGNTVDNESERGRATVRGIVYLRNLPAAGIVVYLEGADGSVRQTTSAADGAYEFADVVPGKYIATTRTSPPRRGRFNDEHMEPAWQTVAAGQRLVLEIVYYAYDPSDAKMPYGAPPVRRRVV
jgi:hypothetical protein